MADAELERTTITVDISGQKERFVATAKSGLWTVFFPFIAKALMMNRNKEGKCIIATVNLHDSLTLKDIVATERFTKGRHDIQKQVWYVVWKNWVSVVLQLMPLQSIQFKTGNMWSKGIKKGGNALIR